MGSFGGGSSVASKDGDGGSTVSGGGSGGARFFSRKPSTMVHRYEQDGEQGKEEWTVDLRGEENMYSMRGGHALTDRFNGVGTKGRALTRCVTMGHSVSQCGRCLNCHTPHTLRHS